MNLRQHPRPFLAFTVGFLTLWGAIACGDKTTNISSGGSGANGGSAGSAGISGNSGASGTAGDQAGGNAGNSGSSGAAGNTAGGSAGDAGASGASGTAGNAGSAGSAGAGGQAGSAGSAGGGDPTKVVKVVAGGTISCAIFGSGQAKCWGDNLYGQLGYGNVTNIGDNETPDSVGMLELGKDLLVSKLAAGSTHTCALLQPGGVVKCWGWNEVGQLGYGNTNAHVGPNVTPVDQIPVALNSGATDISLGYAHTCALLEGSKKLICWGEGSLGRLGYGNEADIGDDESPHNAGFVGLGAAATMISAGGTHTCALVSPMNKARCWGNGGSGQLGYGANHAGISGTHVGDDDFPSSAGDIDIGQNIADIVAGHTHTCSRTSAGKVRCWGKNAQGQLGVEHTNTVGAQDVPAASSDVDLPEPARQVCAGSLHTCALLHSGAVHCWGSNALGQLGNMSSEPVGDDEPVKSGAGVDLGGGADQISCGDFHTCALLKSGEVMCWGQGTKGQLGYGSSNNVGITDTPKQNGAVKLLPAQ